MAQFSQMSPRVSLKEKSASSKFFIIDKVTRDTAMSAKGKTAKETSTTGCGNEPSAPRDSVREERRTSFSESEQEPATKMPRVEEFSFAGKDAADIGKHLEDLFNGGDTKGLETVKKQLLSLAVTPRVEMGLSQEELIELHGKACILKERLSSQQGHVQVTSSKLGSMIHSLGLGSSAGRSENRETVDAVLTSYSSDDKDRKGAMLAHSFYRSFLKHIYNTNKDEFHNDLDPAKQRFQASLGLIWKETKVGIVRHKNTCGSTPEAPATSLLAADINQLVSKIVDVCEKSNSTIGNTEAGTIEEDAPQIQHPCIKWVSEYTLHHVEDTQIAETTDAGKTKPQMKGVEKNRIKCPRTDGLLVAVDPNNRNVLRALVSMEAKLNTFDETAKYQNRSNAIDAYSQQEPDDDVTPWPLLLFRYTLRHNAKDSVAVLAFVPTTPDKGKSVMLWESHQEDAIYRSIVAAVRATSDFIRELHEKKKTVDYCSVHGNVVLDEEEEMVYKCFFDTERRHPNVDLICDFVDSKAERFSLGHRGCYVKMKWVGSMLTDNHTCCMLAFLQIARELQRLHNLGYCHGDIRVSNLILHSVNGDKKAKLVDFDLAGKKGKQKYPYNLLNLVDGARHEDIQQAIKSERVGDMTLQPEHDWSSLVAAMKCFEVKDKDDADTWEDLIKRVENSNFGDLNDEDLEQKVLKLNDKVIEQAKAATDSPKKGK